MRVVIQRVSQAEVKVDGTNVSAIGRGLLILLGIEENDTEEDCLWLSSKIARMRIFNDEEGKMNLSVNDVHGQVIVVSQFTLHANTKKGTRPSFIKAAPPETAIPLYEKFISLFQQELDTNVLTGTFGANMQVSLVNEGPVTIFMDSKNKA